VTRYWLVLVACIVLLGLTKRDVRPPRDWLVEFGPEKYLNIGEEQYCLSELDYIRIIERDAAMNELLDYYESLELDNILKEELGDHGTMR